MSTPGRTALIALGGCAMGAAVVLVVVLTNPDADATTGEVALLFAGGAVLGGLLTLVRHVGRSKARAAGRAARRRTRGPRGGEIDR